MAASLVTNSEAPDLSVAQRRVRELREGVGAGDPEAIRRCRSAEPQLAGVPDEELPEAGIRFPRVVARECGFNDWIRLAVHIASGAPLPPPDLLPALVDAVERPDTAAVREILAGHPHMARARLYEGGNELGDTLLHRADANGSGREPWQDGDQTTDERIEVARALLASGAEVNATGGRGATHGETPLGAAGWAGNTRMARFLLAQGADPNHKTPEVGFDALTTIAGHMRREIVEAIMESGAPVEPRHLVPVGLTGPLAEALDRDPGQLHALVDMGHFDGDDGTLLHIAVFEVLEEMVAWLLERGAGVDAPDSLGRTPLQLALMPGHRGGNPVIIGALIGAGARIGILEAIGQGDRCRVAEMLEAAPALLGHRRADGTTPLHAAAIHRQPEIAALLLERGADVHATDAAGRTPVDAADGDEDILAALTAGAPEAP